jgi:hypothetical protein
MKITMQLKHVIMSIAELVKTYTFVECGAPAPSGIVRYHSYDAIPFSQERSANQIWKKDHSTLT